MESGSCARGFREYKPDSTLSLLILSLKATDIRDGSRRAIATSDQEQKPNPWSGVQKLWRGTQISHHPSPLNAQLKRWHLTQYNIRTSDAGWRPDMRSCTRGMRQSQRDPSRRREQPTIPDLIPLRSTTTSAVAERLAVCLPSYPVWLGGPRQNSPAVVVQPRWRCSPEDHVVASISPPTAPVPPKIDSSARCMKVCSTGPACEQTRGAQCSCGAGTCSADHRD